jgi:hypothetical protein
MRSLKWALLQFAFPLALVLCVPLLHVLWPLNVTLKVLTVLFLPAFSALFHLSCAAYDRPPVDPALFTTRFRRCRLGWESLNGAACVVLMVFEIVAAMAFFNGIDWRFLGGALTFAYVPYVLLTLGARWFLVGCLEEAVRHLQTVLDHKHVQPV